MKKNTFNVHETANGISFYPVKNSNAMAISVEKLDTWFKSEDFLFNLWVLPVSGYLSVDMKDVSLLVEMEPKTKTVKGR
jgi:hypothetical protein